MWKRLKTASMSWQCHRMVLSTSNDVAGTRKCFFAAFSSAMCLSITPLQCHNISFTPNAHEEPKHAGGQKPPAISCFFKPPSHNAVYGTNQGDHQPLHTTEIRHRNAKMPSALLGTIGDGSGAIMRPILTATTPRESNETPWKVSRHWGHKKCQHMRVAFDHLHVSCPLRPPSPSTVAGMNKDDPQPPLTTGIQSKNTKVPPASSESTSALPGNVGDDQACGCAHLQGVHHDSVEIFRSVGVAEVVETPALHALFECPASAINLYVF